MAPGRRWKTGRFCTSPSSRQQQFASLTATAMTTNQTQHQTASGDYDTTLTNALKTRARELGFELVGVAPAVSPDGHQRFVGWLDRGLAGEMHYMERRREAYAHPRHVLPPVHSVVMVGLNYQTEMPETKLEAGQGRVSRYAWGAEDYHTVLRRKLGELADFLHRQRPDCRTRTVVDTAPLLERDFARMAGLGWFGKNTMLINKWEGSWFFLGALLTDIDLLPDAAHETSHCGTCTRCLDACPTDAFPEPFVLDATRCISYLTIELRESSIPEELRSGCREWLFGCDICQDVCPWNHKAPHSDETAFQPRSELAVIDAAQVLQLDTDEFHQRFRETPLLRSGRGGLLRNACIVLGNTGDASHVPALVGALADPDRLIRGAAAWALGAIGGESARAALQRHCGLESDADLQREAAAALLRC